MAETLDDIIRRLKRQGMPAIQVQKWLRDHNYAIPWVQTLLTYNKV